MTLVKFKNRPVPAGFNNFMDDFFTGFPSMLKDDINNASKRFVPVNIKETDNSYQLEVVAPGFEKEDFKISLENNILSISAEKKTETEEKEEKHLRKEYKFQSFKRSFTVDENINTENIEAKYTNGVLTLNLPKREEVKQTAKQISIQ